MALVPANESTALASVVEALANNPNVDVDKLRQIIDLQRQMRADLARESFNQSFAAMQREMPVVIERARTNNGTYATLEDIVETVRPILSKHGFSLSHRTDWPEKGIVKITGILAHAAGHERTSEFLSGADSSGNKNAIQGLGSAMSYGRRYTTNDLCNIVTRNEDDDAKRAGRVGAPDGYDDWLADVALTADEGLPALQKAWNDSRKDYKAHLTKVDAKAWEALKAKAAKVKAVTA
jgi:hypothetical protein